MIAAAGKPPEIVVTAIDLRSAIDDIPPVRTLTTSQILGYGDDTIGDLLQNLDSDTHPPGSDKPVILMNGKRVSDASALANMPPEALDRIEILPTSEAIRFGGAPQQRVVNLIVKHHFRAFKTNITGSMSAEGGGSDVQTAQSLSNVNGDKTVSINLNYEHKRMLRESARDIRSIDEGSYDFVGNVIAPDGGSIDPVLDRLTGEAVTIAGVPGPHPTISDFVPTANQARVSDTTNSRSLIPASSKLDLSVDLSRPVLGMSLNLTGGLTDSRSRSLQGPATALLDVPAGNPFSPFSSAIIVERYLNEVRPLTQNNEQVDAHLNLSLLGFKQGWMWQIQGGYDRSHSRSIGDRGVDLSAVQDALTAGNDAVDPFAALPGGLLGSRLRDKGISTTQSANASVTVTGTPIKIARRKLMLRFYLSAAQDALNERSITADGDMSRNSNRRGTENADIGLSFPLVKSKRLGTINLRSNGTLQKISDFRAFEGYQYGMDWVWGSRFFLSVTESNSAKAPSTSLLVAPNITTSNVPVFDYVRGETALVNMISGGNPGLKPEHRQLLSVTGTFMPVPRGPWNLTLNYSESLIKGAATSLPNATDAVELAFPDRFIRTADGTLLSVDERPINIDSEKRAEWSSAVTYVRSFGKGGLASAGGQDASATEMHLTLKQTWLLRDRVVVRNGLPVLDLLAGDTLSGTGLARHNVAVEAGGTRNGLGCKLTGQWKSGTQIAADNPASALHFSGLGTVDIDLFADLGHMHAFSGRAWAKNMRIALGMKNVSDSRMHVSDGLGQTPLNYQPDYIDPLGRTISLSIRKII